MFTPASYFHALQGGAEKPPFLHLLLLLPPPAPPPVSVTKKDAEEDNLESLGLRAQEQAGLPSFPLLPAPFGRKKNNHVLFIFTNVPGGD